jgi:subtilisin family serine protease
MDFIMRDAASRVCPNGVFVNVSLGSSNSPALNAAVRNLVEADIFVAVAAGNRNYDAIDYSPANEPLACTVGATNQTDGRAAGTNFGSVVDVFAPGQGILSTGLNNSTYSASGTSTATPHVVGLAAYLSGLKGYQGARATCARIAELATKDVLSDLPSGTANRLAYNGGSPRP